jgi:ribosomal protein S18
MLNTIGLSLTRAAATINARLISTTRVCALKKIDRVEDKASKTLTIEGKYLNSEQTFGNKAIVFDRNGLRYASKHQPSKQARVGPCVLCELEKRDIRVQYTDVLVLRQFLAEDGTLLPRKVTGLCRTQNIRLMNLTKYAMRAGLILNLQPRLLDGTEADKNPRNRKAHLKWNTYFDTYEVMKATQKYL